MPPDFRPEPRRIDWSEAGPLIAGLALAMQPIQAIANDMAHRHDIGARGAFILVFIADGVIHPRELATRLGSGRSVITHEVGRLTAASLVTRRIASPDRRFVELSLTPEGQRIVVVLRDRFSDALSRSLQPYTPAEVELLDRMLRDIRRSNARMMDQGLSD